MMEIKNNINEGERVEKARSFFHSGFNCAQSVALAYADVVGLDEDKVAALTAGFGGGFGRLREVCGCVSGMTFVAGAVRHADGPSDREGKTANYALVQRLADDFKEINGSIICRELLGLAPLAREGAEPSARTPDYYRKRPCEEMVGIAAGILARRLGGEI